MKVEKRSLLVLWIVGIFVTSVGFEVLAQEVKSEGEEILFMDIPIVVTGALTKTSPRLVPAAVTTITEEQIQASGARSLFELLDIYVPNLQWIRHHWESDHLGLRGIINDKDDKYLLLVNGRIMNERTHYGAMSERDLVLLRDIHHIDIVRGPGSAMYGPGAVSMVINIITYNAKTFQGTEVTTRLGAIEEFYSGELKHGQKFDDDDGGVFAYAGIGKYVGASKYDAPQIFAFDFPGGTLPLPSDGTKAGEPLLISSVNNDREAHRNLPPVKLHVQITRGDWDIWARYTRGGQQGVGDVGLLARKPYGWAAGEPGPGEEYWITLPLKPNSYGYQQATGYIGYKKELNEKTNLDLAFSYDMFDLAGFVENAVVDAHREDEYYGKAMLKHDINKQHKIAVGFEVSHEEFGYRSPGWPGGDPVSERLKPMPRWSTNRYSILGEHQWTISDQWTTFLGARVDDHTYTKKMFSPRVALIYTPNEKDTYKLMWSRSVRENVAEEMKYRADSGDGVSDPEILDSVELRYERRHSKNLDLAASIFVHYNLELISWSDDPVFQSVPIGTQKEYGAELEASYHTKDTRLAISHGYTKLYDFDLAPGVETTLTTAKPNGYGDDLANWSNHITKLTAQHKLDDKWTLDASMRIYWGFPGMKDYNQYKKNPMSIDGSMNDYPVIESGWKRAYRGNYYLNLGLQYKASKDLTIGVTGYNLLGIFNKDFNKRNYYAGFGDYRCEAVAVGVSLTYKF